MEFGRIGRCAMGSIGNRIPEVGMRFRNSDEAWEFWVQYGGHIGFDVRKRNTIKSRIVEYWMEITDLPLLLRVCMVI